MQLGFKLALCWFLLTAASAWILKRNFLWCEDPFFEFWLAYWGSLLRQWIRIYTYIYVYIYIYISSFLKTNCIYLLIFLFALFVICYVYLVSHLVVDCVYNVMAHGDARVEKWRRSKRMEWVTSKRHVTAEHGLARVVQTLQADVHSSPASSRLNWPPLPPPTNLNGLVRLAERRKLVSAHVPSRFKRSLYKC
jgi:hypothetical protein